MIRNREWRFDFEASQEKQQDEAIDVLFDPALADRLREAFERRRAATRSGAPADGTSATREVFQHD